MAQILITEHQLNLIKENIIVGNKRNDKETVNEAWYNTVMDVLGIFDPTPIIDIINATSYFIQGDNLFGVLSIVGAIPYAGDFVAKPVLGALKIGGPSVKALESAIKLSKGAAVGSKEYKAATETIEKLAKEPGAIGSFLKKMGGSFGDKVIKTIDEIPAGPFKGMKNTIKNYFELLSNAGKKGAIFQKSAGDLAKKFQKGTASVKDVELLKNYLKTQKAFSAATITKPGFFTNVFFGGIPRLFRSPDQRRIRILMQSTKWWLGLLDYIGVGNWVGAEELVKEMGDENFMKKVDEYNETPEAKQNFEDQFGSEEMESQTNNRENRSSSTTSKQELDPLAKLLRNMLMGQINPIPGL
jgi:hypothetical protein